jgi:hypothetical protein
MIEISSRLNSISKNNVINDENNLSQNLFHNGKYYSNIKDIFGQKKFENKKLLKEILEKQIKDKTIKEYNEYLENEKYKKMFNENQNKLAQIEKEKEEQKQKQLNMEKMAQKEQMKNKKMM